MLDWRLLGRRTRLLWPFELPALLLRLLLFLILLIGHTSLISTAFPLIAALIQGVNEL